MKNALGDVTTTVYDEVGRTKELIDARGKVTTFLYDDAGNQDRQIDPLGRRTTWTYDAAGNLTKIVDPSSNVTSYTWDDENKQTKVQLPSSEVVTNTYNGDGLRVMREDSSVTKKFIWDEQNYLAETDENDQLQAVFTQKPDEFGSLIGQRRKVGESWLDEYYHFDALGSTVDVTDSSEATKNASPFVYDAWGNLQASYTFMPHFLYVGELGYYADDWTLSSDTLDYYVRARTYDPVIARWLSEDPLGLVDGLSMYGYVGGNSVTYVDPSGEFTLREARESLVPLGTGRYRYQMRGRRMRALTDQEVFDEWIRLEEGREGGTDWIEALPACPCSIFCRKRILANNNQLAPVVANPDKSKWSGPAEVWNAKKYHPGGKWELRSLNAINGHGEQCVYNEAGNLIESGFGAGTADWGHATTSRIAGAWFFVFGSDHLSHDVETYNLAYKLDIDKSWADSNNILAYKSVRPTSDKPCTEPDW